MPRLQHQRRTETQILAVFVQGQHIAHGRGARDLARQPRVNGMSSSCATTWFTSPIRSDCAASTKLPVIDISRAARMPTARGSSALSPQAGVTFRRAWVSANLALSDATMNDELSAISSPPATHAPFTAQMTGVRMARSARPGFTVNRRCLGSKAGFTSVKSTPAVNAGSVPVRITAFTAASWSAVSSNSHSSRRIATVSALRDSGRLNTTVRMPLSSSTSS